MSDEGISQEAISKNEADELEPVTDPRQIAEGYALTWESWAATIRRHPEIVQFGPPGGAAFNAAMDAAEELDNGNVDDELDELDIEDDEDDD
jgi:hypothetical protein